MSKDITVAYNYNGDFSKLKSAVYQAIQKMNLNTKIDYSSDSHISVEVSEKMKWLSTNWPVSFKIESQNSDNGLTLVVKVGTILTSYTQEISNQAKINEFIDLVKAFAPNQQNSSIDDLEKLALLKEKGIITEDEFSAKKKQVLGL